MLAGVASSDIDQVTWSNDQGGSGVAVGTQNWSVSNVNLVPGTNTITVFGLITGTIVVTDMISVFYDPTAPSITITSPSSTGTFDSSISPITVAGTASDSAGITSVTWINQTTGAGGTASGTVAWSFVVALAVGSNVITVSAHDGAGNTATATITINRTTVINPTPPPTPPPPPAPPPTPPPPNPTTPPTPLPGGTPSPTTSPSPSSTLSTEFTGVNAIIIASRDCMDGDDGVVFIADRQHIVNKLVADYQYSYSQNRAMNRVINVPALEDGTSQNAFGVMAKAVTLIGLRRQSDVERWARIMLRRQSMRTRVEGAQVHFTLKEGKFAHLSIGDPIAFTWPYGPTRENNNPYTNEILRIVDLTLDARRGGGYSVIAQDLGDFLADDAGRRRLDVIE
jgi:hypothetical protein